MQVHQHWSSKFVFILAAVGFSVGLGNIWRFPYMTGENGGGAFVLVYLACVLLVSIPIVMAELAMGRRGGMTPATTFARLAEAEGRSRYWSAAGWLAIVTVFLIISYYCVIGGWTLHYVYLSLDGALDGIDSGRAQAEFDALLENPRLMMFWQALFIAVNVIIIARGLHGGIERAVKILMPLFFGLLLLLAVYAVTTADAARGIAFLFQPDFSRVTWQTGINAMGQAFFSVGVGMAVMMTYGAYLPKTVNIPRTAAIIALADTGVALIAGLAVFPFVFAHGLAPSEGVGLVFVTLPIAFAGMEGGGFVSVVFFLLLGVAALTTSIAAIEVLVSRGEESGRSRPVTAVIAGILCWLVGLATVFSFNRASEFRLLPFLPGYRDANLFEVIDRLTATIGLPLGGLLVAVFAGHVITSNHIAAELGLHPHAVKFRLWRFLVRWPIPLMIASLIFFN